MGVKDCWQVVMRFPMDKTFTAKDVSDDINVCNYMKRMCNEGLIVKLPEKVKVNGRLNSQYRRVVQSDVLDPFEPWREVWPELFMMPKFNGVIHRYVQEI